jgi:hypothetical protein
MKYNKKQKELLKSVNGDYFCKGRKPDLPSQIIVGDYYIIESKMNIKSFKI